MKRLARLLAVAGALFTVSVAAEAATLGQSCGGLTGATCHIGLSCQMPAGSCGIPWPLVAGTCEARPRFCNMVWIPVCGCNGKTYANDCQRKKAGVSKLHDGKCLF